MSETIESMERELGHIREASLKASRDGKYMDVARLTTRAADLNRKIYDAKAKKGDPYRTLGIRQHWLSV